MKLLSLLAMGAMLAGGPALAADPVVLKMSADTPSSGTTWKELMVPWAQRVEAASNGTLKIELYPDGQMSKNGDTINRIAAGVVDVGWDLPLIYGQRFASLGVAGMPGLYLDPELAGAALYRGYEKGVIGAELKDFKVIFIQAVQNVSFYLKDAPKSRTDLSGQKIALGSKARAKLVEAMGGTPIAISTTEYYQAVSKGVASGVMSTIGAVQAFKIDEQTHYYLYGPFGGGATVMLMNKAKYESLPPEAKKAIDDNSGLAASKLASKWLFDFENSYLTNSMLKVAGNRREDLTEAEVAKWQPAFNAVIDEWVKVTPNGQAILDTFKAELKAGK